MRLLSCLSDLWPDLEDIAAGMSLDAVLCLPSSSKSAIKKLSFAWKAILCRPPAQFKSFAAGQTCLCMTRQNNRVLKPVMPKLILECMVTRLKLKISPGLTTRNAGSELNIGKLSFPSMAGLSCGNPLPVCRAGQQQRLHANAKKVAILMPIDMSQILRQDSRCCFGVPEEHVTSNNQDDQSHRSTEANDHVDDECDTACLLPQATIMPCKISIHRCFVGA